MFGQLDEHQGNYGGAHPIVAAHAKTGRDMFSVVSELDTKMTTLDLPGPVADPANKADDSRAV